MAEFIRDHAFFVLAIILILIVAGNVAMFLQSKDPNKNLRDWFSLKDAGTSFQDPWKKETDQLNELSERVSALQKKPSEPDQKNAD